MSRKVKVLAAALAVGTAVTISGCGGCLGCNGCAGCNGETVSTVLTRSNWYTGTSYNGIQPTFIEGNTPFQKEEIIYDVVYDDAGASNSDVKLEYKDGSFKTEFYATRYDWTDSSIPQGYKGEADSEIVYIYRTKLNISVKYSLKKGDKAESDWFDDSVETVSYFRAAGKNLQPVYSRQDIKSTSPAMFQPVSLEDAYRRVEVVYENFYNYDCTKVFTRSTENGKNDSKEFENIRKNSDALFDNSSLYTVIRSLKLSQNLSQTVTLFSAAAGGIDTYSVTGTDVGLTDSERTSFTQALAAKDLYKSSAKEGETDKGVESVAVNVAYAGGNLQGTTQTVWFAAIPSSDNNISRTTMLKLSVPISFGLGTLNYSLKEIVSTLWA